MTNAEIHIFWKNGFQTSIEVRMMGPMPSELCFKSVRASPQQDSKTFGIVEKLVAIFHLIPRHAASKIWHCAAEVSVLRTAVQRRGHGLNVAGTCAQIPVPESLPARTAVSLQSASEIVEANSRQERNFYRKENYRALVCLRHKVFFNTIYIYIYYIYILYIIYIYIYI